MKRHVALPGTIAVTAALIAALGGPAATRAAGTTGPRCYVDDSAGAGGTGNLWEESFNDLQLALSEPLCTEIWVATGHYHPGSNATDQFVIPEGRKVYGGFAGSEGLLTDRNPWVNQTVLTADIGEDDDPGGDPVGPNWDGNFITEGVGEIVGTNNERIVYMHRVTSATVLDGFIITGASAAYAQIGAGLLCDGTDAICSPTLANLAFYGNANLNGSGGGMALIASNHWATSPRITNNLFSNNSAAKGGGVYVEATLGGVVRPLFTNASFTSNYANSGGGMFNTGHGGIASPTLKNATFDGNSGSGMYNFSTHTAGEGGTTSPVITNATFHGNSNTNGGGIYNEGTYGTLAPKLTNVILWGNTAGDGDQMYNESRARPSIRYSVVELGDGGIYDVSGRTPFSNGTANNDDDPLLTPLQVYGPSIPTMLLSAGSPAINKGLATVCPSRDANNIARQGRCDIGATEAQYFALKSIGAEDGWVREGGHDSYWGDGVDPLAVDSKSTTLRLGDETTNEAYRSIVSFDTSLLPDSAQLTGARLRLKRAGVMGTDFFTVGALWTSWHSPNFGDQAGLEWKDFHEPNFGLQLEIPSTLTSGWYAASLDSLFFFTISKTEPTQVRLEFHDDDNDNGIADYISIFSGNALTAQRPQLVITYYIPPP